MFIAPQRRRSSRPSTRLATNEERIVQLSFMLLSLYSTVHAMQVFFAEEFISPRQDTVYRVVPVYIVVRNLGEFRRNTAGWKNIGLARGFGGQEWVAGEHVFLVLGSDMGSKLDSWFLRLLGGISVIDLGVGSYDDFRVGAEIDRN